MALSKKARAVYLTLLAIAGVVVLSAWVISGNAIEPWVARYLPLGFKDPWPNFVAGALTLSIFGPLWIGIGKVAMKLALRLDRSSN